MLARLQAMADLDWTPEFGLYEGLKDSYDKDFGAGTFRKAADFTTDDMVGGVSAFAVCERGGVDAPSVGERGACPVAHAPTRVSCCATRCSPGCPR